MQELETYFPVLREESQETLQTKSGVTYMEAAVADFLR